MPFSLAIKPSALKELQAIPKDLRGKLALVILDLSRDPRPPGVKKLSGGANAYRVRVTDYRVVYEISEPENLVRVMVIGHRRDVYR